MRHAHLSERKFKFILKLFAEDLSATKVARIGNINRNAANALFDKFRGRICNLAKAEEITNCTFAQLDESFFGPRRIKGKKGRGAGKKIIVFGIWDSSGNVYCEVVPNCRKYTLLPIIMRHMNDRANIHTDGLNVYRCLKKMGYNHNYVRHQKDNFYIEKDGEKIHTNNIESHWSWSKERLIKFHGLRMDDFAKHLIETVFRFNHRQTGIYEILLNEFRAKPL